jgi:UDP-glucose 4-epimerase
MLSKVKALLFNPTFDWYVQPSYAKLRKLELSSSLVMAKKFPTHPAHPERTCWGCDLYCASHAMSCGNGADRTQHPVELFGEDWQTWDGTQLENKSHVMSDATQVSGDTSSKCEQANLNENNPEA